MFALACLGAVACDGGKEAKPKAAADGKKSKTPKSDAKSDAKADAKTDAKTDAKVDAKTDAKVDAKSDPAPPADAKADAAAAPEAAVAKVDPKTLLDDDGTYNYGKDALGELASGLADKDVVAKLGEPKRKEGREEEAATGDIVDLWHYPEQGIVLTMRSQTMTGPQSISGITIKAPCPLQTKLGVGVGSTRADVVAGYGAFKDPEFPAGPEQFIAGSVYGGTFFDFTKDEVVSIFMGAGAE